MKRWREGVAPESVSVFRLAGTGAGLLGIAATLEMIRHTITIGILAIFASVQGPLAMYPIWDFGSEEQKEKYLPKWPQGNGLGVLD